MTFPVFTARLLIARLGRSLLAVLVALFAFGSVVTPQDAQAKPAAKAKKLAWPKGMREQIATLRSTLGSEAMSLEELSSRFTAPKTTTPLIVDALEALEELGMLYQEDEQYRLAG